MPTVILLDVSLSMSRPVYIQDSTETHTRYTLACVAINHFLDHLNLHSKLEYVAVVAFSSLYEVVCNFTRDYNSIRTKLRALEQFDRTSLDTALHGVNHTVLSEWGHQTPVQIILVTDGTCGLGHAGRERLLSAVPLPPPYPARIHILCVISPDDPALLHSMPIYQKLVDLASTGTNTTGNNSVTRGAIYVPEQKLSPNAVQATMARVCEAGYMEFFCRLRSGQMEARVHIHPPPAPAIHKTDFDSVRVQMGSVIDVIGFIPVADIGTPMIISKHLILPQALPGTTAPAKEPSTPAKTTKDSTSSEASTIEEDSSDPSKIPNFCVLLHGALKVEGMCALVTLCEGWWGLVWSWGDAARSRRSSLLLCALAPGPLSAPALGPLNELGPADESTLGEAPAFPVRSAERRSYAGGGGGGAAWARPHALHSDIQKVLRHARKLPDKTQQFYKELNRIRRAAISLGFVELLSAMADVLERECATLAPSVSPDCSLQLTHAAHKLREPRNLDVKQSILPLPTNFNMLA